MGLWFSGRFFLSENFFILQKRCIVIGMVAQIIAYLIASFIPALALWLIYSLDFYKTGEFKAILASFLAGVMAFWVAAQINFFPYAQGWLSAEDVIRFSAPAVEEVLKGLILWLLVSRPRFTYFVEGAVYGFAAGVGFAIVENYEYLSATQEPLMLAVNRVISTNLMHAAATSILGIVLGLTRFESRGARRLSIGLSGLLAAILLHMGYNNLVTRVDSSLLLLYASTAGLLSAGLIAYIIQRGLQTGKAWLEESLTMTDRVTSGEAAVVTRMENIDYILAPLAERFGEEKAEEIKDLLTKQARLGFLRKSLEHLSDERMKRATEEEIARLRIQVDVTRRKVGSYAMLFLRHTFPEYSSPLWGRLETLIQERAAARPDTGGMNLWNTLKERQEGQMKPNLNQEQK
jgi:RsiW-degrading membrane proteinase PrsW (M82 family)